MKYYAIYEPLTKLFIKDAPKHHRRVYFTKDINEVALFRAQGVGSKIHQVKKYYPNKKLIRISVNRKIELI